MTDQTGTVLDAEEYRALKSEMVLRIQIQNTTLLLTIAAFTLCMIASALAPDARAVLLLVHSAVTLAPVMQWCHQGVRQIALKQAIMTHDAAARRSNSWEVWLPTQRPDTLLGSRWFVSTKAVFIGLNGLAGVLALRDIGLIWAIALCLWGLSIWALLTNPKE